MRESVRCETEQLSRSARPIRQLFSLTNSMFELNSFPSIDRSVNSWRYSFAVLSPPGHLILMNDSGSYAMDTIFNDVCVLVTAAFALTLVPGFRQPERSLLS